MPETKRPRTNPTNARVNPSTMASSGYADALNWSGSTSLYPSPRRQYPMAIRAQAIRTLITGTMKRLKVASRLAARRSSPTPSSKTEDAAASDAAKDSASMASTRSRRY